MNINFSNSIRIKIEFDDNLKKITNTSGYKIMTSSNISLYFLLNSVFSEHPEIMKKYKPGELGFTINNNRPSENSILIDGDVVHFQVS